MGLVLERKDVAGMTTLVLEFPKTAGDEMEGLSATEIDEASSQSGNSKALAGSHVLVVASRREVRVMIRDALRNMSMLVDFVGSVEEAASFCREGLPHAIIIDSIQKGSRFTSFRDEIVGEVPDFVFIEILEQGSTFEMSGTNGAKMARIGRDVIASSLPAALMFELSRGSERRAPRSAAEDLREDRAAGADRVAADLLLLLADHDVEAVERLARDVALDVGIVALTSPMPAALPATALKRAARSTFAVSRLTIGRKRSPSGARVLPAKNFVTESWPPATMPRASPRLIDFTADTSSALASGTAASAARFIAVTSSSTRFCWPVNLSTLAASLRKPGSGMRTFGLPRKPSGLPSSSTAAAAPRSSAARMPEAASALLTVAARAGPRGAGERGERGQGGEDRVVAWMPPRRPDAAKPISSFGGAQRARMPTTAAPTIGAPPRRSGGQRARGRAANSSVEASGVR